MSTTEQICEAIFSFLKAPPRECSCYAVQTAIYAHLTGNPYLEPAPITEARCEACDVLLAALQSTLTPDALLTLAKEVSFGNPVACVLADLLASTSVSTVPPYPEGYRS